jgi:hypothetical protein
VRLSKAIRTAMCAYYMHAPVVVYVQQHGHGLAIVNLHERGRLHCDFKVTEMFVMVCWALMDVGADREGFRKTGLGRRASEYLCRCKRLYPHLHHFLRKRSNSHNGCLPAHPGAQHSLHHRPVVPLQHQFRPQRAFRSSIKAVMGNSGDAAARRCSDTPGC